MKYIGAHVSISGGVQNAPLNAAAIGAKGFAMFTKNQRQWQAAAYTKKAIQEFKDNCARNGYTADMILPHDGYLINLGQPDDEKRQRSIDAFLDEMQRCEALGLKYLNFHPGSHLREISIEACLDRIADAINEVLAKTERVVAVAENTAGQGSNVGNRFEELAYLIERVDNKDRIGVCIDTCHAFAAGYDFRTREGYDQVLGELDRLIGIPRICGFHLNDAKGSLSGHLDRHAALGEGMLGIEPFKLLMADRRLDNIPFVLETPEEERWAQEIELLYSFT